MKSLTSTMNPDDYARKNSWLVLSEGKCYAKRYSVTGTVYIFMDEFGMWEVWRATHLEGRRKPKSEKTQGTFCDFKKAIAKGESFIEWWNNQPKGKGKQK